MPAHKAIVDFRGEQLYVNYEFYGPELVWAFVRDELNRTLNEEDRANVDSQIRRQFT